jgi:hypothetical protein
MTVSQLAKELQQAMENQNVPPDAAAVFWDGSQTHAIQVLIARHRTGDNIWIETVDRYRLTKAILDICLVQPNWGTESEPRASGIVWFEVYQRILKIARDALHGSAPEPAGPPAPVTDTEPLP